MRTKSYPIPRELRLIAAALYLLIALVLFGIHVATDELVFPDDPKLVQSAQAEDPVGEEEE